MNEFEKHEIIVEYLKYVKNRSVRFPLKKDKVYQYILKKFKTEEELDHLKFKAEEQMLLKA